MMSPWGIKGAARAQEISFAANRAPQDDKVSSARVSAGLRTLGAQPGCQGAAPFGFKGAVFL